LVASRILETKLPQTRNGYLEGREAPSLAAK
jgi:3-sulfinopropanoyl-CoA desulfinase